METSNRIQHQHLAPESSRSKITIGPQSSVSAQIKLNRHGDLIESFEIQCACGEIMVIKCEYE